MNIFLDTTVTFSDPFLKKNYNRNLLKMVRDYKDITFYMSEIVYKETKRHFERNVKKNLESLHKIERNLQSLRYGHFTTNVDVKVEIDQKVKDALNEFETFYSDLEKEGSLHILSCPDNLLSDLIDRSVNRIKPFKENKSEFRDAATWLTYTRYAEQESLSDCYFITENVTDFLDDKKENIHPHLLKDSKKFQHFLTLTKLTQEDENVRKYIEEKQNKLQKIQTWIEENNINEEYVIGYFKETSLNGLFNELYDICADYVNSLNRHHLDGVYLDGQSLMDGLEIINIQDFTTEIMEEEIIVSGELILRVECSYLELIHLSDKDPLSVRESMPFSLELLQPFSFTMLDNKSITNLQFEEIKIVGKPRVDPTIHF